MYLSRFGVKNYKCLGDIDIPLTPIHVLIGQNDAGKTSLLEAIEAFHASSEKKSRELFPESWEGQDLVLQGSQTGSIEFLGQLTRSHNGDRDGPYGDLSYGVRIDFEPSGTSRKITKEWIQVEGEKRILDSGVLSETTVCRSRRGEAVAEKGKLPDLHALRIALGRVQKYAFNARTMALPAVGDLDRRFRLDSDGFGLATLLDDIVNFEAERFIHLREEFCGRFPQFTTVRVVTEKAIKRSHVQGGRHTSAQGVGKGIRFEIQGGGLIRADHVSDGAILLLGFLALAHLPNPPSLLLLEEPENGVYPHRLREVMSILKEMVQRDNGKRFPQVVLTTHSPYVLSFFEPEEVTFLSRPKDRPEAPVRARPLRDAPNIKERLGNEFYLGELWYNLSEEDLFGEP